MTATDPAERSFADPHHWGAVLAHPEFPGSSRCSPHLSAATEHIRFTLRNVASAAGHILATHNGTAVRWAQSARVWRLEVTALVLVDSRIINSESSLIVRSLPVVTSLTRLMSNSAPLFPI